MTSSLTRRAQEASHWHRTTARFSGSCTACTGPIRPGDQLVRVPAIPGWLHDGDCVAAAEALIRAHAWKRCGAFTQSGRPCRMWVTAADRTRCPIHDDDM